jgi:hypothetical protein
MRISIYLTPEINLSVGMLPTSLQTTYTKYFLDNNCKCLYINATMVSGAADTMTIFSKLLASSSIFKLNKINNFSVIYLPINKSEAYINTHTQKEYYVI